MPANRPINVDGLQKTAEKYDKVLRTLPAFMLMDAIKALHLNVRQVDVKHVLTHVRRHSGGTGPYVIGAPITYKNDLLGYEHSELHVSETVFKTKDNVHNYDDVDVQFIGGKPVDDVTKRHPLEYQILQAMVKTHSEDVMFALFHAERNDEGSNAMSAFDGFGTQIDSLFTDGKLTAARGNYAPTGAFSYPSDGNDYTAYENLCDFIRGAHPMLRSSLGGNPLLYVTETVLVNVREALRNKLQLLEYPTMEQTLTHLREDSLCPGLQVISHLALGSGHRVMLMKDGLLDFGWNTQRASQFIQVRDPFEDPNEVQFWLQAAYGTRIQDWHEKVFRINDQTNECINLAGDYAATGAVRVTIEGAPSAKWYLEGYASRRQSGQYLLGLTPGTYTIRFEAVEGLETPADISITVTAGADIQKTVSYETGGESGGGEGGNQEDDDNRDIENNNQGLGF